MNRFRMDWYIDNDEYDDDDEHDDEYDDVIINGSIDPMINIGTTIIQSMIIPLSLWYFEW